MTRREKLSEILQQASDEGNAGHLVDLIESLYSEEWVSAEDRLPQIPEGDICSDPVLCLGTKMNRWRQGYEIWEVMTYRKLEKHDLLNSKGEPIMYGWSTRWWNTNPDYYSVHFWKPLELSPIPLPIQPPKQ